MKLDFPVQSAPRHHQKCQVDGVLPHHNCILPNALLLLHSTKWMNDAQECISTLSYMCKAASFGVKLRKLLLHFRCIPNTILKCLWWKCLNVPQLYLQEKECKNVKSPTLIFVVKYWHALAIKPNCLFFFNIRWKFGEFQLLT